MAEEKKEQADNQAENQTENAASQTEETSEAEKKEQTPEERIAALEAENADLKDQLLRRAADFDNYRKRMMKEKQDTYDYANASLLGDLLDSLDKRITFLKLLCKKLSIDAEYIHGRAENISKNADYREKFDYSCARAVANLSVLSEYCIPFVKLGGSFISLKGPNEDLESAKCAISILGGNISSVDDYDIDGEGRRLIQIRKISQTPSKYPRNSAQIKKKSL